MSIRILRYIKKIGVILVALLFGVCSGISTVSAGEDLGSSRARAGVKRAAAKRPAVKRAVANRAEFNRPAVRQNFAERKPIEVNKVVVEEDNDEDNVVVVVDPCLAAEAAFLFIGPVCLDAEVD